MTTARLAIDIGGTFTDLAMELGAQRWSAKVLTTPRTPEVGVATGVRTILDRSGLGAGDIGIYYLKEPVSEIGLGSAVECWVDDNYSGAVVIENAAQVGEATPSYVMPLCFIRLLGLTISCETGWRS